MCFWAARYSTQLVIDVSLKGVVFSVLISLLLLACSCSAGRLVQLALCSTPGSQRTPSSTWQTSLEPPSMRGQRARPGGPAPTLLGCPSSLLSGGPAWGYATMPPASKDPPDGTFCTLLACRMHCIMQVTLCKSAQNVSVLNLASAHSHTPFSCICGVKQQHQSLTSPGISSHACVLQPTQSQTALAARTVSWNPANFSQAAGWLSEAGNRGSDAGRNSQADYAPGMR